jgi:hypothetical protein
MSPENIPQTPAKKVLFAGFADVLDGLAVRLFAATPARLVVSY